MDLCVQSPGGWPGRTVARVEGNSADEDNVPEPLDTWSVQTAAARCELVVNGPRPGGGTNPLNTASTLSLALLCRLRLAVHTLISNLPDWATCEFYNFPLP